MPPTSDERRLSGPSHDAPAVSALGPRRDIFDPRGGAYTAS